MRLGQRVNRIKLNRRPVNILVKLSIKEISLSRAQLEFQYNFPNARGHNHSNNTCEKLVPLDLLFIPSPHKLTSESCIITC